MIFSNVRTTSALGQNIPREPIGAFILKMEGIFLDANYVWKNVKLIPIANLLNVEMIRSYIQDQGYSNMLTAVGGVKMHATNKKTLNLTQKISSGHVVKKVRLKKGTSERAGLGNFIIKLINYKFKTVLIRLFLDPVNCVWQQWGEWSNCTTTCGIGSKSRNRSISIEASNGGMDCSGETDMTMSCNEVECPGKSMFPSNMCAVISISK